MQKNDVVEIISVSEEVEEKLKDRLEEIGLSADQVVTCLRRSPFNGPIVLQLGGSAFALEQDIAQLIQVKSSIY